MENRRGPRGVSEAEGIKGGLRQAWDEPGDCSVQSISGLCDSTGNLLNASVLFPTIQFDRPEEITEEELGSDASDLSVLSIDPIPQDDDMWGQPEVQEVIKEKDVGVEVEQEQEKVPAGPPLPEAGRKCPWCAGAVKPGRVSAFCSVKCKNDEKRREAASVQPAAGREPTVLTGGRTRIVEKSDFGKDKKADQIVKKPVAKKYKKAEGIKEAEVEPATGRRRDQIVMKYKKVEGIKEAEVQPAAAGGKRTGRMLTARMSTGGRAPRVKNVDIENMLTARMSTGGRAPRVENVNAENINVDVARVQPAAARRAPKRQLPDQKVEPVAKKRKAEVRKRNRRCFLCYYCFAADGMVCESCRAVTAKSAESSAMGNYKGTAGKNGEKVVKNRSKRATAAPASSRAARPKGTAKAVKRTMVELKAEARARGLRVGGRKQALLDRLGYGAKAAKAPRVAKEWNKGWPSSIGRRSSSIGRSLDTSARRRVATVGIRGKSAAEKFAAMRRANEELMDEFRAEALAKGLPTTGTMEELAARLSH